MRSGKKKLSIKKILAKRKLSAKTFKPSTTTPTLASPLEDHVAFLFETIFRRPYSPSSTVNEDDMARAFHGIQHSTRAALYVPVLVNLRRRYGDEQASKLTDEDIKLVQIALLLHDSMRLGEGEDRWDAVSGEFVYFYLTETLGIDKEKARKLADAVKDKDDFENSRTIYQKLVHDADCLDVRQVRAAFKATELDFHRDFAAENPGAFRDQTQLIVEVHSLIEAQGDGFDRYNKSIKKRFESATAYQEILKTMVKGTDDKKTDTVDPRDYYKIFPAFYKPLPEEKCNRSLYDEKVTMGLDATDPDQATLAHYLNNGYVLTRGITTPSFVRDETKKFGREEENGAAFELRKAARRPGIKTRTDKPDNMDKDGNKNRSGSLIVKNSGSFVYCNAGFLIYADDTKSITQVNTTNNFTGYGKKKDQTIESKSDVEQKVQKLIKLQKMGGAANKSSGAAHNELLQKKVLFRSQKH